MEAEVTVETEGRFGESEKEILERAKDGVKRQAEAILKLSQESMEKALPGEPPAPPDEPPRIRTGTFYGSLDVAGSDGFYRVGAKYSEVGLRGAWFEFGGREVKPWEKGKKRKRKYHLHPFVSPPHEEELPNFAPRVAGTFTN